MNKTLSFLAIIVTVTLPSCLRLDDNLFNPSRISSYKLDRYEGEKDFELDESYKIPDSLIYLFTLKSGSNDIYALYIGSLANISQDTVIMYCHGNRDHMDFYWQRAKLLANTGGKNRFGVMMIDYRGYGLSQGKATEEGLYEDVDAAMQWLRKKGLTEDRLVMYGFSLGTAPATELTANLTSLKPSKLILEAPFASAEVMVQDASALALPSSFFTNLKIDNAEEIKKVQQPFLWLHGTKDNFLSIKTHGEIVFKNYTGIKGIAMRVDGANHNNVPVVLGFEKYKKAIFDFIRQQ